MKRAKVDHGVRIGGDTRIPVGTSDSGGGKHEMSHGVKPVGHVPADAGKFNRDHTGKRAAK
jgi:hypothetical protein